MLIGWTAADGLRKGGSRSACRAVAMLCAGAAIVLSVSGCSEGEVAGVGVEDPGFAAFLQDCTAKLGTWRDGQITYPSSIALDVGGATSYRASIDVGQTAPNPPREIPGNETRTEPIIAQCAVAARLVPVGAMTIDPAEWSVRTFTPSAKVDWSWTVSTEEAKDQQLLLEVQPALRDESGYSFVGNTGPRTASYTTDVTVAASPIQKINQFISDNRVAALGIGAALAGVLAFAGTLKRTVLKLLGRPAKDDDENGGEVDEDGRAGNDGEKKLSADPDADDPSQGVNQR